MITMEAVEPPPLPPKQRKSSSSSTTTTTTTTKKNDYRTNNHVIKIHINPDLNHEMNNLNNQSIDSGLDIAPCIRINVNSNGSVVDHQHQHANLTQNQDSTERQFYYFNTAFNCSMSSGQVSPSDTLDSGTCSDLDCTPPPPPLPAKTSTKSKNGGCSSSSTTSSSSVVTVTVIGATHKRIPSLTSGSDSDDNLSNISFDSLNNNECNQILPRNLLQDIRQRNFNTFVDKCAEKEEKSVNNSENRKILDVHNEINEEDNDDKENLCDDKQQQQQQQQQQHKVLIEECTYEDRHPQLKNLINNSNNNNEKRPNFLYETDKFYDFHLNEHIISSDNKCFAVGEIVSKNDDNSRDDESFAGYKDILSVEESATIRSAKGTVRGVKNRVRAGIATFLQINDPTKTYKEKDGGKVVVYTTTMGIVRETYQSCTKVKQILRTLLVKYEERDVFMSTDYQAEIRDRMRCDYILVPQVFVDGQHIGDAETVEKLNESGELRRILKPYKSMDVCTTCKTCGGFNLLPCPVCNGSKKSVHRNDFTAEFVALKCMNCDEVGLVKCTSCAL